MYAALVFTLMRESVVSFESVDLFYNFLSLLLLFIGLKKKKKYMSENLLKKIM